MVMGPCSCPGSLRLGWQSALEWIITSGDTRRLDASFAGRMYDEQLSADVHPCAEDGEFHTLVVNGPVFRHPLIVKAIRLARRGHDLVFGDLVPID